MRFLVGGYTADMGGEATGIGVLNAGAPDDALAGGALSFTGDAAAATGSPSWITRHPHIDVVYAALEGAGTVQAFRRTGEASFSALGDPVAAGESPCHIAVSPAGDALIAACWSDGRVVRMRLDAAGRPTAPTVAPPANDPYGPDAAPASAGDLDLAAAARALREAAGEEYAHLVPDHDAPAPASVPAAGDDADRVPHAHETVFLPRGVIATTDMGFDLVRLWRDDGSALRPVQDVVLPRGSGPRHMVWHPSGHLYVVAELSCEVFVLAPDAAGTWRLIAGAPLGPGTLPGDTAAEIALSHDASFLYAGVRGSDTVATLRVRGQGETIQPVALVEAGVHWPRHHVVARDTLLVAGQLGDEIASLTLDLRTGVPTGIRHRTPAPSPTCLVPLR